MADPKEANMEEATNADSKQQKIATAVKFLQNPRVRSTPMSQRRAFLEKKGLTKEEIDLAVEQSGTAGDVVSVQAPSAITPYQPQVQRVAPLPYTWRGYLGAAVIGGSLGYIIVTVFKKFILPLITHKKQKDERLRAIENSVGELSNSVMDTVGGVQTTLDSVQKLLIEQQKQIICLSADLSSTQEKVEQLPTESYSVNDLKSEIISLKGLLLNRKAFPSPLDNSTPAGIPSWQRAVTAGADSRTTDSASTSFAASKRNKDGGQITESGTYNSSRKKASYESEHKSMNGEISSEKKKKTPEKKETPPEVPQEMEHSHHSNESSDTDTPNTVKSAITNENLDDAVLVDSQDISLQSNDTSASSLSDMSANASFNEESIAFSSTCIKVPAEASKSEELPSASAIEVD
ncbi:peroxisomal membrane protein PEX14 [Nematostella vectensis]|uniref:peroxisomal membrane protein PEX14 n=1 Tax=Nematostella vectensis TaxID=45351 RepID=UPI00207742C2|nr:peroxisomal membrane protein PEX14 [Nematostella vectensis]